MESRRERRFCEKMVGIRWWGKLDEGGKRVVIRRRKVKLASRRERRFCKIDGGDKEWGEHSGVNRQWGEKFLGRWRRERG